MFFLGAAFMQLETRAVVQLALLFGSTWAVNSLVFARVPFDIQLYKGTSHGFHNDTSPIYDPTAACDAWARTLAWFNTYLRPKG